MPTNGTSTDGDAPSAGPERPDATARRESAVRDVLRRCVKDLMLPGACVGACAQPMPLKLDLLLVPESVGWDVRFDPPLAAQLLDQIQDAAAACGVYRDGAAFCFKCARADCAHARPPEPDMVFAGFDPMGLPEWKPLAQVLLELRDPHVDRLFAPGAPVRALAQPGRDLKARQLPSFGRGSRTYGLLGQVVAGYVRADAREPRRALTFQVVETFAADRTWGLRLNLLGRPPGDDLAAWLADDRLAGLRRARDTARRDLARIEDRARAARAARDRAALGRALGGVPALLQRLAQSIERAGRQTVRRTRHADARRTLRRPVSMAVSDTLRATPEAIFEDGRTDSLVVCGEQGRAHVFSHEGRHVTSFVLPPGGAETRVRIGRWRRTAPEDAARLQAMVQAGTDREP